MQTPPQSSFHVLAALDAVSSDQTSPTANTMTDSSVILVHKHLKLYVNIYIYFQNIQKGQNILYNIKKYLNIFSTNIYFGLFCII